jgi:hypothetical protein
MSNTKCLPPPKHVQHSLGIDRSEKTISMYCRLLNSVSIVGYLQGNIGTSRLLFSSCLLVCSIFSWSWPISALHSFLKYNYTFCDIFLKKYIINPWGNVPFLPCFLFWSIYETFCCHVFMYIFSIVQRCFAFFYKQKFYVL